MSAGAFVNTKYESNAGTIYFARVQQETLDLDIDGTTNDAPAGDIDGEPSASMSGSRRKYGVNARSVSLSWTADPPDGYEDGSTVRVPILTPAVFNGISRGDTGTYLDAAVEVVGKSNESIN
jgi:hypothetical protein